MTKETNDESDIGNMEGQQKPTIKQQKQQQAQKQNEGKNDETVALFAVGTSDPTIPAQVSDIVGSTSSHNKQQDEIPFQFDDPIGTGDTAGQEIYLNGSENDQEVEVRGQADAIPYFQADSIENNFTVTHDKSIQENPSTEAVLESNQNHADSQNGIVDSSGTVQPLNTHSSYSLLSGDSSQSSGIPFSQISYSELENPTTEAEAEVQVATTTETNQAAIGMGSISRMTYEPNVEEPYLEFNEADEESIPFGNENNNPIDEHNMSGGNGIMAAAQPVDEPIPFDGDGDLVLEQPAGESEIPFNTKSDSSSNTAQSVPVAQPVDEPIPFGGDEEMVLEQPVIESKIPFVMENNGNANTTQSVPAAQPVDEPIPFGGDEEMVLEQPVGESKIPFIMENNGNANTAQSVPAAQPVDEPIPFGGDEEMVLEQPVGETVTFDNVASNTDGVLVENAPISEPIPFDSGDGLVTEQVSTESIPFGGQGNYQEPAVEQNSPINESVPVGQEASDILAEEQPMLESQQPVQFGISHGDSGPSIEGGATVPVKVEEKEEEIPFGENTGGVDEYCNGWEIEELQEVEMEAGTGMEMQVEAETGLGIKQSETSEVEVVQQQQQEQQQQQQQQNDEFNPFGHEASMQQEFWKTSDESIPFVTETQVEGDFFSMLGSQDTQGAGMVQSQTQAQTQPIQQEQYQQEQYQQEQYQQEQYQQEQYQQEQYQEEQADQVGYGELAYDEQSGQYYDTVTGDYYDLDYQQYYNAASDSWYYIDELGNKIVTAVAGKAVEMIQPQQQLEPGQFEQQQFEPGQFEQQQQFEQQEQYVQQQFQPGQFEPQQFNQQLFEPLQEQGEFQMQNYYQEEQLNGPENAYSYQMQQEQKIQQEQREGPTQHIQNDQLTFESTGAEYDYNEDYSYGYNYEYEAGESQPLEQNYEEKGLHQDYNYEQLDEYSSTHYTQDTSSVYQPLMEGEIVEGQILEEEILEEEVQAIPQKTGCRPLITFGFGGQVVMYFQTAGQVEITSLGRIVGAEHTAQVEDKPFVFEGSVSRAEDLLGAMTQAGERCQDEMKQTWQPYVKDNRQVAMEKAMWAGLNVLVSSRGFLEKMDKVRLTQLCDELSRIMELNQVGSNENTSDYNNPETVTGGYGTQRQLSQIEQLLVKGEKKQAVDYAIEQKLWAQALIIASCTAREVWKSTVEKYVNSFQQTKSAQHQVLGIQYLMFAGVDDATIFPSPSSTATFGSSNDNVTANIKQRWPRMLRLMLANYATGQSKAIVALGDQLMQCGETAAAHLCYALTLSSSILFRKKSTDKCAGIQTALLAGKGSGNVDSALLVWNRETELALKWTQIYEVAQVVNAASKANANINTNTNTNPNTNSNTNPNTNPNANVNVNANANNAGLNTSTLVCLPHFQAYKLSYAIWLADCGHLDLALLHCNCLLNIVESAKKQKSQAAYLHPRYMAALNDWRDRLVNSGVKPLYHDTKKNLSSMPAAASNEKAWLNLSVPRPSLSSILNVVDSGIDKLISGSTSTSNAPSPVYPIPASDHHQPSASSHPTKQTSKDPNAQPVWELGPDKYAIPADYSATKRSLNFNPNPPCEFMAKTRSTPTFIDSKLSSFNNPNLNDPITNNSLMRPPSFDRTSNRGLHSNNSSTSNFSSILQQQQQQQQQPSLYNPSSANTTPKTSLDYGHGARFEQKHQPPVNDDDDLLLMAGFGNKALKPPKKPASSSLDSDSASKDISTQKQDQQGQRQSQEKDQEQEQEQAQQQTATGGRFGFGLLKNFLWAGTPNNAGSSSANNDPKRKQKKADLGEENSFVFDPVLKRWVNKAAKGAGGQEPSQPTPPPPPPMMPMMQMAPPPPQQQQQQQQQHPPPPSLPSLSNTHPSSPHSTPRPSLQGLVNGGTPVTNTSFSSVHSSPSLSSIPAGANTPTMPPGPTMGSAVGGGGGRRKNVRSRYVDVFNPS